MHELFHRGVRVVRMIGLGSALGALGERRKARRHAPVGKNCDDLSWQLTAVGLRGIPDGGCGLGN
jgi:hypothetical protein